MTEVKIKLNGVQMLAPVFGNVLEVSVDTDVYLPSMFTILLDDTPTIVGQPLLKFTDDAVLLHIGAKVEISVKETPHMLPVPVSNTLFEGEITSIEPVFREDGKVLLRLRGYDAAHRLTLGKKTRAWGTGLPAPTVTEAQIVTTIAKENGLTPVINPAGIAAVLYKYVMQYNQSDWDFLWARARMLGYQVYVEGKKLYFSPASVPRQLVPLKLSWGDDLRNFRPRFVTAGAVTSVKAQGWNPDMKRDVSSSSIPGAAKVDSTSSPTVSKLLSGSTAIKTGFGTSATDFVVSPSISTPGIGLAVANARFLEHESSFVRASGETLGHPNLMAGSNVLITNVGVRFGGTYYVTQARHIIRGGEYNVEFDVSGRNPYTFGHLMGQDPEINKIYGAVIALVTDLNDPLMQGRVKVKFPWMPESNGAELSSDWARMATLSGGKSGIYFSPEVNDEVLVIFDQGDVNLPFIVGVLWNGKDNPPDGPSGKAVMAGQVNQRIIKSHSGHVIVLNDTPGKESIIIQDKSGNKIEIDSIKNEMTIKTMGNLTLDVGGKFSLKSKLGFEVKSDTNGTIEGNTGIGIKAGASQLDLQAATAALKSAQIDIQANAAASLKGGAMVEIQGALVKIN